MPVAIKKASIALMISFISSLIAVYIDRLEDEGLSFKNPVIFGVNTVWALVIAWFIWDLFRGKDIKWALISVGFVMLFFLIWDIIDFGFGLVQGFYALELTMFMAAYIFVRSPENKSWYAQKKQD